MKRIIIAWTISLIVAITIQIILLSKGIHLHHAVNILLGFCLGYVGIAAGIFLDLTSGE